MQKLDYRNVFAISQSAIKAFRSKSIQKFKQIFIDKEDDEDDDQDKYAHGSLVDTIAFEPTLLDARFFIPDAEVEIPSEKIKLVVDRVYKEALEIVENKIKLNEQGNLPEPLFIPDITNIYDWADLIIKHAREVKYGGTTWSASRILDNVYESGGWYFRMLGTANGRSVISAGDNADAIAMVEALRADKYTRPYFIQQENETLLFQTEIFVDYQVKEGLIIPLKGAIDIIRLNHNTKTVRVPDLKTSYNSENFAYQARQYGYCTQGSFYNFLVREWLKTYEDGKYADYEFEVPCNIVIDRTYKIPYIYEYTWEDIEIAQEGSEANNIIGWKKTLEEISWHIETGIWDRPKELYETGKITLKIYNK